MPFMYEMTIKGEYQNQLIINQLTFTSDNETPATATAFSLIRAMGYVAATPTEPAGATFFDYWLDAQTAEYQINEIMVRNLYSVTDFFTVATAGAGWTGHLVSGASDELSFVANKLMTNRVRSDIGRGSLALTPFGEDGYDPEGNIDSGGLALLQAICDTLNEQPSFTIGADTTSFVPTVFQKEEYPVPDSGTPPRTARRYYADPAVQLEHAAIGVSWQPKGRATSQTSRRIGKGK